MLRLREVSEPMLLLPWSATDLDPGVYFSGLSGPFLWIWRVWRAHLRQYVIHTACAVRIQRQPAEQRAGLQNTEAGNGRGKGMCFESRHWASALWPCRIKLNPQMASGLSCLEPSPTPQTCLSLGCLSSFPPCDLCTWSSLCWEHLLLGFFCIWLPVFS